MSEALLFIWIAADTKNQAISTVRYGSMQQCETARTVIINDDFSNPWKTAWFKGADSMIKAKCLAIPKPGAENE